MGRSPCCDEIGLKKGPWTPEEDQKLVRYIQKQGHGSWRALPKLSGLNRCGKSCRLRWTNYLRPDIKRGKFSQEEEQTILNLHSILGNKWSAIASQLPGRTDNEIKNFWNTHLKKKLIKMGFDPMTHQPRSDIFSSLPNLIALANLKELIDNHSWEEQAVRLRAEMANLQYLQYLLEPSISNSLNNHCNSSSAFSDIGTVNLLNSLSSYPKLDMGTASLQNLNNPSISFSHLPDLLVPCSYQTPMNKDSTNDNTVHVADFPVLSQGDNSPNSPWQQLASACSSIPSPMALPPLTETSINNLGDACSTSSSYGGSAADVAGSSVWPELLLEDPLFHEIA